MAAAGFLSGERLRDLCALLGVFISSPDVVTYIIEDSKIAVGKVARRDVPENDWREVLRAAERYGKLDDLFVRVERELADWPEARSQFRLWLSGYRSEVSVRETVTSIVTLSRTVADIRDPTDAVDVLSSLRLAAADLESAFETSSATSDNFPTLRADAYRKLRDRVTASCRRLRAAIDHLLVGIDFNETMQLDISQRDAGEFVRMHTIVGVLIDDRETVTRRAHELVRLFRDNSPLNFEGDSGGETAL